MLYLWRLVGAARSLVFVRRHQGRHALICAADAAGAAVEVDCKLVDLHQMHAGPDRYSFLARLGKRDSEGEGKALRRQVADKPILAAKRDVWRPEGRKVDLQGTGSGGRLKPRRYFTGRDLLCEPAP
jgi:hypothetical protein